MRPFAGFGLIAVSLFMLLGFFQADLGGSTMTGLTALMVAVGIPGVAGAMLLRQHFGGARNLSEGRERLRLQTMESELLRLAREHDGKLTVVEVVQELALAHEDAESVLQAMVRREVAELEITDSGLLVYSFPDIQRLNDKPESRGILDA